MGGRVSSSRALIHPMDERGVKREDVSTRGDDITPAEHSGVGPLAIALLLGAALWTAASLASGRREAWDAPVYWALAYPAALVASAVLGYFFPVRTWRWPLALFAGQFIAMVIRSDELGGLWPLGLVMFGVLALPAFVAARIAARFAHSARTQ